MTLFNNFFMKLATLVGGQVAQDHLRLVFTLLAGYPLALIYKNLIPTNHQNLKHSFSILIAIFVLFGMFDLSRAFYIMILDSVMTYTIMQNVKGVWGPRLVFLCVLGHLSVGHIYRQIDQVSYDRYDVTGPHMVLVIKLTSFAFNVYDGQRPSHELSPFQRSKSIPSLPSILEYMGYIFFFGGFFVGPTFEFMDYRQFVNMEMFRVDDNNSVNSVDAKIATVKQKADKISKYPRYVVPNGFFPAMGKLGFGLFWIVCLVMLGGSYSYDWMLSDEFKTHSFFYRLYYVQLASFCARIKYYVIWLIAEGACILSGIGFNGYDERGSVKWDRVSNINVIAYESADNIKSLLEAWNMNTNKWLKNYVYLRITPPGKKQTFFSTLATFGTSALWHGFYPGYYLTFAGGAFVQALHRTLRRNVRPIFLTKRFAPFKYVYNCLSWLATQSMINYLVMPFNLLTLRESLYGWGMIYFCGHIAIIMSHVAFLSGAKNVCKLLVAIGEEKAEDTKRIRKDGMRKKSVENVIVTEIGVPLVDNTKSSKNFKE